MRITSLKPIQLEKITIRKAEASDSKFIVDLFEEKDIANSYAVAEPIKNDYSKLLKLWLVMSSQEDGVAWIIEYKSNIFTSKQPCGFIVTEYANSKESVLFSYALATKFRGKGIMTSSLKEVEKQLKNAGVYRMEAFIAERNIQSIKLIQNLNFTKFKDGDVLDTAMIVQNDFKVKELWIKELAVKKIKYQILDMETLGKMFSQNGVEYKIWKEENSSDFGMPSVPTGRYHFLFRCNVTEGLVGISSNLSDTFRISWELENEESYGGKYYLIFSGWGDLMTGGSPQFEGWKIGIERKVIVTMTHHLMSKNPQLFSIEKMKKVIGLESFHFG